jgi:peptidoglycan/xylan/chitin deacetylase (PgdA/CDA1 family)
MFVPRDRVVYSPIVERPKITWPGGARVALWVSPNIEHYELVPPVTSAHRNPWPRMPAPDVQQYSYRDYGNRVGMWRMTDACDEFGIRCTVSLNLGVLDHYPEIAEAIRTRDWSVMSHGIYNTRYLNEMSEDEERMWLQDNIDSLKRHTGQQLRGMLGPAISGTPRTPDIMAQLGLTYHADWVHDDQPVPLRVEGTANKLVSVPYSYELDDAPVFAFNYDGAYFADICKRQFDVLYEEGADSGRVMCIALHPFLIGQPHMINHLRDIFRYIRGHDAVWMATADEIAEHYIDNFYDAEMRYSPSLTPTGADLVEGKTHAG